ncbi:hypothetical protein HDU83_003303 [Entophlyctis luteolus]|nr:hypothetical protein HDU83_003303 [Entophlyctis luteolus]
MLLMYLAIAQASAASCVTTYPGGYCSDFVNYPFFLASGNSVAAIENTLKAGGIDLLLALNKSTPADRACLFVKLSDSVDQVTTTVQIQIKTTLVFGVKLALAVAVCLARKSFTAMIFYFAIGVFLLHVAHCMDVGSNGTRASCVDNITEASSYNSKACIVQGFLINFAAIYLASWIGLFKLNLFLSITWHLDWFSERYVYLHVATLVVSIGPSIGLVATNDGIDWMDKLFDHLLDLPSANPDAVDRAIDKYWYE